MKFTSALAIYVLFWAMCFFFVLPFRPSHAGEDRYVRGQADSAPPRFSFPKACLWTTLVATLCFGLYYANYVEGWVTPEALDFFGKPPSDAT